MSESKTDGAAEPVDYICLNDIRDVLDELEHLGFVKRTGEFENGYPVFVSSFEGNKATETRHNKEG